MTATLDSVERHSMGDLTLHIFHFGSIGTVDTYGITNMPGVIGVWKGAIYAGTTTDTMGLNVDFANSSTGPTLRFVSGLSTTTADVFVLSHG